MVEIRILLKKKKKKKKIFPGTQKASSFKNQQWFHFWTMKCNQIEWIWSDFGANRLKWSNLSSLMYVVWHTHPLWRFQRASWPCSSSLPCLLDCWRARSGALHLSTHSEAQDTRFLTLSQCPRLAGLRKWKQAPSAHRMQHHSPRPFWAACKWRVPLLCSRRHIW